MNDIAYVDIYAMNTLENYTINTIEPCKWRAHLVFTSTDRLSKYIMVVVVVWW